MNTEKKDFIVYIGRFSPPHNGHITVIRECLKKAKKVIVCIGTANSPRTIKNPWTARERENMIYLALSEEERNAVKFQFIEDNLYQNNDWATNVRSAVRAILMQYYPGKPEKANVGLAVPEKDSTSWYINLFPEWPKINMPVINGENEPLSATQIREAMFLANSPLRFSELKISKMIPDVVSDALQKFMTTETFNIIKMEYTKGIDYEHLYDNHPKDHSINFYTADSVVFQSGHVLLIKRRKAPGKGLWALPGGHVNPDETSEEASLRELGEETNIDVQESVLTRCLVASKNFDHPDRSMRARITRKNARSITVAYCYKLDDSKPLPRVKPGDDAEEAWWFPVETVINTMSDQLFEDHKDIIKYFYSRLDK